MDLERVAVHRAKTGKVGVVVETTAALRAFDRLARARESVGHDLRTGRAHARIDRALPRVHVVRRDEFARAALEGRVVDESDAGLDANAPCKAVGGDFGHRGRSPE